MEGGSKMQAFAVASEIFWNKSLLALKQRRTNVKQLGTTIENTRFIRIIVVGRISAKYNEPTIAYILLVAFQLRESWIGLDENIRTSTRNICIAVLRALKGTFWNEAQLSWLDVIIKFETNS